MSSLAIEVSCRALAAWMLCAALAVTDVTGQADSSNISCSLMSCQYTYELSNSSFSCPNSGCAAIPVDMPLDVVFVDLRGNTIKSIDVALQDYKQLKDLDLSKNAIGSIAANALPENLVHLNLSNNLITMEVLSSKAFAHVDQLEYLNVANNRIENLTIPNIFWLAMPKLRLLDLSGNQIMAIGHNALTDLRNLEGIDLSRNQIKDLEAEDFMGLAGLSNLNLSRNQLGVIPDRFFHGLDAIRTLDLSYNLILELSNTSISGGDALETLHLEGNKLRRVPSFMSSYLNLLQFLYIDENPLESIEPKAFPSSLKVISIRGCNSLVELRDVFGTEASQLTTVSIKENPKLKFIHYMAFGGPEAPVKDLDLSNNALTTLSESLVNWSNLTSVTLAGNYWDCDCNMEWVKHLPESSHIFESLVCYNPLHLKGSRAVDLEASQFSCSVTSRYRRHAALLLAICFTAIVITSLVLILRNFRHQICPSMHPTGKYETLYSSAEAAADDDLSLPVKIQRTGAGFEDEPVAV